MRWLVSFGLALSIAACRQTVVFDQTGVDAGGPGADSGPLACSGLRSELTPEYPEVIVALDRSAGMNTRLGDTTALFAARDALAQHAPRYQKAVWFGYVDFPGSTTSACGVGGGCCTGALKAPSFDYQRFDSALHACEATQSCASSAYLRPSAEALYGASLAFNGTPAINRWVLLITNGRPDCDVGQFSGCGDAQGWVNELVRRDVGTIVIVPGQIDQDTEQCLQGLATAGFRQPQSPDPLGNDVGQILGTIATAACVLDPDPSTVQLPIQDSNRARLYWNNTQIPQARNGDGWELTRQGFEITLHGEWCERLIAEGPDAFGLYATCEPPRP